jgi:CheY-like chemotaxis protein
VTATRAAEALQHYQRQADRIQAVLTDIMMPFGDGQSLIAALRAHGSRLSIVAMSGVATAEFQRETLERGASVFLSKPFSAEQLLAALGGALAVSGER